MPKNKGLTRAAATTQAAGRVRQLMPGELVTVQTRGSWDLATNTPLMITTITYPPSHPAALDARAALMRLKGVRDVEISNGYMSIVREA